MIKYDEHSHSFSYDSDPNSSEMPSIEDVRKDKYGNVILRMIKLMKNASLSCYKFNGEFDFSISIMFEDNGSYLKIRSISLKDLFDRFTDVPDTLFYKKSYDEVLVALDLLETDERNNDEHK